MLSFRDELGQWEPRNQRPEVWELLNTVVRRGESVRAFPSQTGPSSTSGATSRPRAWRSRRIYFAHEREVFERDGMLFAVSEFSRPNGSRTFTERVRYRTVGDLTVTGAVRSEATDFNAILSETAASTTTERGATRADDRTSSAAMKAREREGSWRRPASSARPARWTTASRP